MEHYVGLDVSLKLTAIRTVDRSGKIEREGVVTSDPAKWSLPMPRKSVASLSVVPRVPGRGRPEPRRFGRA